MVTTPWSEGQGFATKCTFGQCQGVFSQISAPAPASAPDPAPALSPSPASASAPAPAPMFNRVVAGGAVLKRQSI